MLLHGRRRTLGDLPVVDGSARACNETFSVAYADEHRLSKPHACKESFALASASAQSFTKPTACKQSFTATESVGGEFS